MSGCGNEQIRILTFTLEFPLFILNKGRVAGIMRCEIKNDSFVE
jgi:hypothetical protein